MRALARLALLFGFFGVTGTSFGDLYRIRMLTIPDLHPGCTTEITFVVDHTRWPQQSPADPARRLQGLSFGVVLPQGVTYESHTFDGTHLKQMLGSDPWFGVVSSNSGGFGAAIIGDPYLQTMLPEGISQIVLKVTVKASTSAPMGTKQITFTDFGEPEQYLWLSMPIGNVVPYTQPQSVNIMPGTCSFDPHFWAAAVGQLDSSPNVEIDTKGDVEEVVLDPDPADLEFPDPTEDELQVQWLTDPPEGGDIGAESAETSA